jgi:putative ABC transport system permease protein
MTRRDFRSAEVRVLAIAVAVAVSAMSAVAFLADRFNGSLEVEAAQALGGQLVLHSDRSVDPEFTQVAERMGLRHALTVNFPSMATVESVGASETDAASLVSVKAVDANYPLIGNVQLASNKGEGNKGEGSSPIALHSGEAWVEQQIASRLRLHVGDKMRLGDRSFRVADIIIAEPDRGLAFVNIAPRAMIRLADLASTNLDQPGARLSYRLLIAGEASAVANFQHAVQLRLARGQRIESTLAGEARERPEMFQTLDRARTFLLLASMQAGMVSALAIALAARRFALRRLDACALMRCLGSTQMQIALMFLIEFLIIGIASSGAGVLAGYAIHAALLALLSGLVNTALPFPSSDPAIHGMLFGVVLLCAFALAPVLKLSRSSPMSVLRRSESGLSISISRWDFLAPACLLILFLSSGSGVRLTLYTLGGYSIAAAIIAAIAAGAIAAVRWLLQRHGTRYVSLRLAVAGLARRTRSSVAQVIAIALGLSTLMLLQLISSDLLATWQEALGPNAPNRFVLNIQPDQRERFVELVKDMGFQAPETLPMVRGRLVAINGESVNLDQFKGSARRLVDREFNLSYMARLPQHNSLLAGRWWESGERSVSVEEGLAEQLHLKLGDRLAFDVAGHEVEAPIVNLRKVQWTSMQVNFFVIFSPAVLADSEQSFISTMHVPPGSTPEKQLVQAMNNLTVIDTGAAVAQLQSLLNQLAQVIRLLAFMTLIAGLLVLAVVSASSRDDRLKEVALLRSLGASRRTLALALWAETGLIGLLSGILAAVVASILANALGEFLFELPWAWHLSSFLFGSVAGVLLSWLGGWWGTRHVARQSPLLSLREA